MHNDTIFVGDVKVLPSRRLIITSDGEELVDPLVMKLLLALVSRHGGVASRDELIAEVWDESYASDTHLSRVVWGLRRALGDSADNPAYVETVPRVGYRLIPDIRFESSPNGSQRGARKDVAENSRSATNGPTEASGAYHRLQVLTNTNAELKLKLRWMQRTVAVLAMVVIGMALLLFDNRPDVQEHNIEVIRVSDEDGVVDSLRYEGSDPFAASVMVDRD